MRELRDVNESLNTVKGVSQRGFDQPAWEAADPRTRTKNVVRPSAYRLTKPRSGTDTSVVAVTSSPTQNGEETIIEHWWSDLLGMVHFIHRPRYRQRETRVRLRNRGKSNRQFHSRPRASRRRIAPKGSLATGQREDSGQKVEARAKH